MAVPNTPAGSGYGLHFLNSHLMNASGRDPSRYGPPSGAVPFADHNTSPNAVGSAPVTEADAQVAGLREWTSGVNRSTGDHEMSREILTVANTYGQRGTPVVIQKMILAATMDPVNDPHFRILPLRKMSDAELAGVHVNTITFPFHMPDVAAEFIPPHFKSFTSTSFTAKPTRYNIGWRIGMDMIATKEGQKLEFMFAMGVANDITMLAAITVTSQLTMVNDMYHDERMMAALGAIANSEINNAHRSYEGPLNNGQLLARGSMFGILNRHHGLEYMMQFVRRVMGAKKVSPNFVVAIPGALEAEAYRDARTEWVRRGKDANRMLREGEEAIKSDIRTVFGGIEIVDEHSYEPANMSPDRMNMLVNNAQVGRFNLLTNEQYHDYRQKISATASAAASGASCDPACAMGGPRLNDLYYLNLTGRADVKCIRYEELVKNACCFDDRGRLDIETYEDFVSKYDRFCTEILGVEITNPATFKPDPWLVMDRDECKIVRTLGNQDLCHTNAETTKLIVDLSCNSISQAIGGAEAYRKIQNLIDFMDKNYNVSPDMDGYNEGFVVASAWENVADGDLGGENPTPHSVANTKGGVRLPRVFPITVAGGRVSQRHLALRSRRDGRSRVLVKVRTVNTPDGPVLYSPTAAASGADTFQATASRDHALNVEATVGAADTLAWANPHYAYVNIGFAQSGTFDDATGEFLGLDVDTANAWLPENLQLRGAADLSSIRLVTVPQSNPNGITFPFYSTVSAMRGIVETMTGSTDGHGWVNVDGGAETLRMIKEGLQALDSYAIAIKNLYSPKGFEGGDLEKNMFFRSAMLANFQKTGDDDIDELTAFEQNVICGIRGQLGIASPFNRSVDGYDQTFRFGPYIELNRPGGEFGVDFLTHRASEMPYQAGTSEIPGVVTAFSQYEGLATLRNSILPNLVEAGAGSSDQGRTLSNFSHEELYRVLSLSNSVREREDSASGGESLRGVFLGWVDVARGNRDFAGTPAEKQAAKSDILWGHLLASLQSDAFENLVKYFTDLPDTPYDADTVPKNEWAEFRTKWNNKYGEGTLAGMLRAIADLFVARISDDQMQSFLRFENGAADSQRNLQITLNAFVKYIDAFILDIESDKGEVAPWSLRAEAYRESSDGEEANAVQNLRKTMLDHVVEAESQNANMRATLASERAGESGVSSALGDERVGRARNMWHFLSDTGHVTAMTGTRLSVSPDYFKKYDRMMRELIGVDTTPPGVGAAMSVLRPSSAKEPGVFIGAPPIATRRALGAEGNVSRREHRDIAAATLDDIVKHAGACHNCHNGHIGAMMRVGPAYTSAGSHGGRGYNTAGNAGYHSRRHRGGGHNDGRPHLDGGYGDCRGYSYHRYGGTHYSSDIEGSSAQNHIEDDLLIASESASHRGSSDVLDEVADAFLPGILPDEIPNGHFYSRLNRVGPAYNQDWKRRGPLYAYMGAVPSAQLMCQLHENGIAQPMTLIVLEPFIDTRMNAMIFVKGGEGLGWLGHHLTVQTREMDNNTRMSSAHVSTVLQGVILEPNRVLQIPYASFAALLRGGDMRLVKTMASSAHDINDVDWDADDPMHRRADTFVAYGGGSMTTNDIGHNIPLYGATSSPVFRRHADRVLDQENVPSVANNEIAFPSAPMLNFKAEFYKLNRHASQAAVCPMSIDDMRCFPQGTMAGHWNMWCGLADQWCNDPFQMGRLYRKHHGSGALGTLYPGVGGILRGEPSVLSESFGSRALDVSVAAC